MCNRPVASPSRASTLLHLGDDIAYGTSPSIICGCNDGAAPQVKMNRNRDGASSPHPDPRLPRPSSGSLHEIRIFHNTKSKKKSNKKKKNKKSPTNATREQKARPSFPCSFCRPSPSFVAFCSWGQREKITCCWKKS